MSNDGEQSQIGGQPDDNVGIAHSVGAFIYGMKKPMTPTIISTIKISVMETLTASSPTVTVLISLTRSNGRIRE